MNQVQQAVATASNQWIENFNAGNLDGIVDGYQPTAVMNANPKGEFQGTDAIRQFWDTLLNAGYAELEYSNVKIEVLSENQAILSAEWKMNLAGGIITKELWERGNDGTWRLSEDDFAITKQFGDEEETAEPQTALLIIDLQEDYFGGGAMELAEIDSVASNASKLLSEFRSNELPVFHVRHIFTSKNAPFFVPGSEGSQIHSSVQPIDGETVIVKNYVNSFQSTDLHQILQENGIERLVICGAMTHMCIDAAVRAASDLGYQCIVPNDACATRDAEFDGVVVPAKQVQASIFAALGFAYAEVIETSDLINKIRPAVQTA